MPPVSVTMQPRNLADDPLVGVADVLDVLDVLPPEAELWLLPHAAMTSVADTASAAVAHALCFTLTSTGPARRSAWPGIRPGVVPQVMPGGVRWEEETRPSRLLVAESESDQDGSAGRPDMPSGFPPGALVPSHKGGRPTG
jgi:hypothetical protein